MDHEFYFFLSCLKGIGPVKAKALSKVFRTSREFFTISEKELIKIDKINRQDVANILFQRKMWNKEEEEERLQKKNLRFIAVCDENYPRKLRNIYDPPLGLYVKGRLPGEHREKEDISPKENCQNISTAPVIGIVGARNCSYYGKDLAKAFSRELSEAGISVISGMARGIDGYAHEGAMLGQTPSYAVLGCGADICYPAENRKIYEKLISGGGILSEYPPGTEARASHFPVRNRIISGMADGILVIEAKERSGSLITMDSALEQGKDVFAVPGRIGDPLSKGCNNIIKMGANLVDSVRDILEFYGIPKAKNKKNFEKNNIFLETSEKIVYASLRCEPKYLDEIINDSEISRYKAITALISLESKGLCYQVRQNYFIKCVT